MIATVLLLLAAAQTPQPLKPGEPPPKGQQIDARDGDTIVARADARLRILRRTDASVLAIYNRERRWLVLLIDYVDPRTKASDGKVDETYRFVGIDGTWPLGSRWQGNAVLDLYTPLAGRSGGLGVSAAGVFVQFFEPGTAGDNMQWYADARATRLTVRDAAHTTNGPAAATMSFTERERLEVEQIAREAASLEPAPAPSSTAPVRVGSLLVTPRKIKDVTPVTPAAAVQAGARGVVIVEITVAADGSVTDARLLRSIPLLDQAALDAVKQWRYAPTLINGRPVPVIMTVTVAFP